MIVRTGVDLEVVGIDLDETSLDLLGPFLEFHNKRFGTSLSRSEIAGYSLVDALGCSPEDLQVRFDEFNGTSLLLLRPMSGAKDVLERLARERELVVVTSRPLKIELETLQSVGQNFPGVFSGVYMAGQSFDMQARSFRTKGTVCRDLGASYMVDDSLEHAREIRETSPNTKVLLYDHGGQHTWNQLKPGEILPDGVERVHTWETVYQRIVNP
ncbi:MAG: hypothetical protein ABH864_00255 [archaeon]